MNIKLKELFEDVVKQAKSGVVKIKAIDGEWRFYTRFYSNIEGNLNAKPNNRYPIIEIPNYKFFISAIENYLKVAEKFYCNDQEFYNLSKEEFDKKLILDLIINATNFDFVKIYDYIEERTQMLKKEFKKGEFFLGRHENYSIIGDIIKNRSNIESPYTFNIYFEQNGERFMLPSLLFGMAGEKVSVMGIQNLNKEKGGALAKKLDRYFRKLNKDIDMEDVISNVSPNALASFTIFVSYLKSLGFKDITASAFRPVRYHANKVSGYFKNQDEKKREEFLQKHNHNQFNITNKVLYMFLRYGHHFDNTIVFYDDIKQKISLEILDKNPTEKDNIIYSLSSSVNCENIEEYGIE